ncbi:MAG: YihA family ribosome biogenesis GTP-binding protein [Bacteroidales bacterium]|nr:YihA family ribosome biogenesis GTP-binding protein [Bacteroidales bacterium]
MKITKTQFLKSSRTVETCPVTGKPEFAFVGRSNAGKSSLLNMLAGKRKLAKTSSTPGKTKLINHFLINEEWYLVDLPGYGYARTSKKLQKELLAIIQDYLVNRQNLWCLFELIDCRHKPQQNDMLFLRWLGMNHIPFAICFTKSDKLSSQKLSASLDYYRAELLKDWEILPEIFITSSVSRTGRDELLSFIENMLKQNTLN